MFRLQLSALYFFRLFYCRLKFKFVLVAKMTFAEKVFAEKNVAEIKHNRLFYCVFRIFN
jgi:hypothetical protein